MSDPRRLGDAENAFIVSPETEGSSSHTLGRIPKQQRYADPAAVEELRLNAQEQALYDRHVDNLHGSGGVDNPDGSRSTVYVVTTQIGDRTYVIPTVRDGKILEPDEAIDKAASEGLHKFPSYDSPEEADRRYQQIHGVMEKDTDVYLRSKGR